MLTLQILNQLKKALQGFKRVPILLLHNSVEDLSQMGLARYEIVMVECMDDIANHIGNILEELPHHLNKKGDDIQGRKREKTVLR